MPHGVDIDGQPAHDLARWWQSSERSHGWLVVVPLLIVAGWILEMLIMG